MRDIQTISAIAERVFNMPLLAERYRSKMECMMDIDAADRQCRLRLADLLAADDFNFVHDVAGIYRHINRRTGKLEGCFLPRFADLSAQ